MSKLENVANFNELFLTVWILHCLTYNEWTPTLPFLV